jgi:endothelin-converting enzyme/putative endopeptidase
MHPMQSRFRWSLVLIFASNLFFARSTLQAQDRDAPIGIRSGVESEFFGSSIRPGQDFFRYVNDQWLEKTEIPSDQSNYGSFTILDIQTKGSIREIIEAASKSDAPSPIAKQVGDFYASYTNLESRNRAGLKPIEGLLKEIRALDSADELMAYSGQLSRRGIPSFFGLMIEPDAKRSDQYAVYINQDGTSLPDRDYYLEEGESPSAIRAAFFRYVRDMLSSVGWENAEQRAAEIVELETRFAKVQWDKVALRDPVKMYNKMSANEFAVANPGLAWASYAKTAGVASLDEIIVGQPSFFQQSQSVLAETSVDTLKAYLAFQTVNTYAPVLTEDLERMHFAFHETVLSGVTEQEPLWRRGVDACNAMLGMPVGQLYVEKHFSPLAKKRMNELVGNLLRAFEQRIEKLEWMGNGTKAQAKEKLALFTPKIGYPDKWKDYSSVQIVRDDIVGNLGRIAEFEHQYALNKLGKPIDRTEWYMPPQTVNAYYNPLMNEIVFPAAILQPPFFNLEADDAVNYGAIGAVIGHEISHGFDDAGSRFDGRGNLRNWWTENDRTEFEKRANRLVSQYDAYEPLPGMPLSGRFTLGENIGDLGGLSVAYTAYLLSLEGKPAAVLDGFTGEQRFFIGWAQVWRRKYREEEMRKRIKTDPHSPSAYRCNGIVSNLDGFYEAFGIGSEDPMYIAPEKRVRIW